MKKLHTICLDNMGVDDFISYYQAHKMDIETQLTRAGAIKFQEVRIEDLATFQQIVNSIAGKTFAYINGNSPRIKLSDSIYTSTEYDQTQRITMHNELSYSAKWPNKLFFSCIQLPTSGGETLVADSREIFTRMNKDIVDEVSRKGIVYIRNLHGGAGVGPSWQDTFETDDKDKIEQYCREYAIEFEWNLQDSLKLKQRRSGIHEHRITGEKVWFNQIDQFHPVHLGEEVYRLMLTIYDLDDLPMYVTFGDGTAISEDMVKEILQTIDDVTMAPVWSQNELLVVDNELFSHGRNSYTGERRVLVAMSE